MKRELTCINCPLGCQVEVTMTEDGEITNITGNSCKRGEVYARSEVTDPKRMVCSTARLHDGDHYSVPVKTAEAIPKDKIMEVMEEINKADVEAPVKIGQVVVENVAGSGVNVIATANRNRI